LVKRNPALGAKEAPNSDARSAEEKGNGRDEETVRVPVKHDSMRSRSSAENEVSRSAGMSGIEHHLVVALIEDQGTIVVGVIVEGLVVIVPQELVEVNVPPTISRKDEPAEEVWVLGLADDEVGRATGHHALDEGQQRAADHSFNLDCVSSSNCHSAW
jgi:hypothetical protein